MVVRITNANSVFEFDAHAFLSTGPDTALVVEADGFLRTTNGGLGAFDAMRLAGASPWTITVRGTADSQIGTGVFLASNAAITSRLVIADTGAVFGGVNGVFARHAVDVNNAGVIAVDPFTSFGAGLRIQANGDYTIVNSGEIYGAAPAVIGIAIELSGAGVHVINNSGLLTGAIGVRGADTGSGVERLFNSGTVQGGVSLGGGNDTVSNSGVINGFLSTGPGSDVVTITGAGVVNGNIGLDTGNDVLNGGDGVEVVFNRGGNDRYSLAGGDDVFRALFVDPVGDRRDIIDGGLGVDTYDATAIGTSVSINLDTVAHGGVQAKFAKLSATQRDELTDFENVLGGAGDDFIYGNPSTNALDGGDGADRIEGYAGNDVLRGGANASGFDVLVGGAGKDQLWGGDGEDIFVFTSFADSGVALSARDVINDFQGAGISGGDVIDLSAIDANATNGAGANDAFVFLGQFGLYTNTPGELRAIHQGNSTIIEGDVNGDAVADFAIAVLGRLTFVQTFDLVL